ncbi:MAG: outer membrane protein assembly factor BamE [Gammaproteobacteria bacterium]|nr:outer membrane protein assembly factor BamE [Gammaproteobacteria bacterium]MBU1480988.1 outer membrane protein assembly factor BamE [Gammaproteobacteria bacterium]
MKYTHLIPVVLAVALLSACATQQSKTATTEKAPPPVKTAPVKESAKETPKAEVAPPGVIVGKPDAGSKFSKLKIGMTLNQVEKLIGHPTKQWTHPTAKVSIPFYFGPDRWVIQYSYKGEGVLTFNSGGEQFLTKIEVNKNE